MRYRLLGLAALFLYLAGAGGGSASNARTFTMQQPRAIPPAGRVVSQSLLSINGAAVNAGCVYSHQLVLPHGAWQIREDELARAPFGCTMTLRRTVYSRPNSSPRFSLFGHPNFPPGDGGSGGTESAGYSKSWYTDPAGATVNSVSSGVDFYYINNTLAAVLPCTYSYNWLGATGWTQSSHNESCSYSSTTVDSSEYSDYRDQLFCGALLTEVVYDRNHAYGYGSGALGGSWNDYVPTLQSNPCSSWLTWHGNVWRTK